MDIPISGTRFSQNEILEVTRTWDVVKLDMQKNGIDIFISFFRSFPEYQPKFGSTIATVPLSELHTLPLMLRHTDAVMFAMDSVVQRLARPDELRPVLEQLGVIHTNRKITSRAFTDFKNSFLHWIRRNLGTNLSASTMMVWEKTMNLMTSGILQGIALAEHYNAPKLPKAVRFDPNC